MNVFLTGATGYIGHELALALARNNIKVHALIRDLKSKRIPIHNNIRVYQGDVCDYDSVLKAIEGCCYVIHSAAYTNLKYNGIANFYNTNVLGTENVLKAALKQRVKKFIYTSTLSVYGPSFKEVPITEDQPRMTTYANDYELTTSMAEELIVSYNKKGLPVTILNISRVYGPRLNHFSTAFRGLVKRVKYGNILFVPGKLNVQANYVYIDDVIHAHLLSLKSNVGKKYIIGGTNIDFWTLIAKIKSLSNGRLKIFRVNQFVFKMIFLLSNFYWQVLRGVSRIDYKQFKPFGFNQLSTSQKAKKDLNYNITPIDEGLLKTISLIK
ncbi:NAD-dependent epimerase/dehydratase family protein [Aestuariivivens sediminicola]|uniref:NAD-dependent epimerase/dehydratase family protein n=1 Tax=Aestuariivivens sediminicola TaxID=2913560 RepID=UPI001F55EBB4|nr:NAD-dependent epimerase/dehydratase family protein [Aestuariivivens sediminicola]